MGACLALNVHWDAKYAPFSAYIDGLRENLYLICRSALLRTPQGTNLRHVKYENDKVEL